jgi:hypothetical protein
MDTVGNTLFKKLVISLRNYLYCLFDKHCEDGMPPVEFSVNLGAGALKPMLPYFCGAWYGCDSNPNNASYNSEGI